MKQRDRQKFMADNKKTLVMKKLGDDDEKSNPKVVSCFSSQMEDRKWRQAFWTFLTPSS